MDGSMDRWMNMYGYMDKWIASETFLWVFDGCMIVDDLARGSRGITKMI
jgi:hypothetical protein